MRRTRVSLICLTAVLAAIGLFAPSGLAVELASENFESYNVGAELHALDGGSGWLGPWSVVEAQRPEYTISDTNLLYINGEVFLDGGNRAAQFLTAGVSGAPVVADRPIDFHDDTYYMSMLFQSTSATGTNDDFFQFGLNTDNQNPRTTWAVRPDGSGAFDFFPRSGTADQIFTGVGAVPGKTHFLVLRASKSGANADNYDTVELWVDLDTQTPGAPDGLSAVDSGIADVQSLVHRVAFLENGDNFTIDEIKIGTSFADVIPQGVAPKLGDFNFDGSIDMLDFASLRDNFQSAAGYRDGDITQNGFIDGHDFVAFKAAFLSENPAAIGVPEPGTASLIVLGGLIAAVRRRRRHA